MLAAMIGVDPKTYRSWELGDTEPSLSSLRSLCRVFVMLPEELGYPIFPVERRVEARDKRRALLL